MFFYIRMFIFTYFGVCTFYLLHNVLFALIRRINYDEYNCFLRYFLGKFLWEYFEEKIKNNKIKKIITIAFMFICVFTCGCMCKVAWDGSDSPILNWMIKW